MIPSGGQITHRVARYFTRRRQAHIDKIQRAAWSGRCSYWFAANLILRLLPGCVARTTRRDTGLRSGPQDLYDFVRGEGFAVCRLGTDIFRVILRPPPAGTELAPPDTEIEKP